jgi:hypothetical protein
MPKEVRAKKLELGFFECRLCRMVVVDPVECRGCAGLYCAGCLQEYCKRVKQDWLCPEGCGMAGFDRVGRAFEMLMGNLYGKCKNPGCGFEDCLALMQRHQACCRFRDRVGESVAAERDLFWMGVINKILTPTAAQIGYGRDTPGNYGAESGLKSSLEKGMQTREWFEISVLSIINYKIICIITSI